MQMQSMKTNSDVTSKMCDTFADNGKVKVKTVEPAVTGASSEADQQTPNTVHTPVNSVANA